MRRPKTVPAPTTANSDPSATLVMAGVVDLAETVHLTIDGFTLKILADMATFRRKQYQRRQNRRTRENIILVTACLAIVVGTAMMATSAVVHGFVGQALSFFL
jgi:uncharacterized membrane protein YidH (DUF202 family)